MSEEYRGFPGPPESFDKIFRSQVTLLLTHGLTEDSMFLDIGCGPLRSGRFMILFLQPNHYFALEPERSMVRAGKVKEFLPLFGRKMLEYKQPTFAFNPNFNLSLFDVMFDFVLASQVFIHCGLDQLKQCLTSVKSKLKEQGKFFLHVEIGEEHKIKEKGTGDWNYKYADHSWVEYPEEMFREITSQHGFDAHRANRHIWYLTHQGVT